MHTLEGGKKKSFNLNASNAKSLYLKYNTKFWIYLECPNELADWHLNEGLKGKTTLSSIYIYIRDIAVSLQATQIKYDFMKQKWHAILKKIMARGMNVDGLGLL